MFTRLLKKLTITSVLVIASEAGELEDGKTYTFAHYTAIAKRLTEEWGNSGGYMKAHIEIAYPGVMEYGLRHDIGSDPFDLNVRMAKAAEYYLAADVPDYAKPSPKLRKFYEQLV